MSVFLIYLSRFVIPMGGLISQSAAAVLRAAVAVVALCGFVWSLLNTDGAIWSQTHLL